MEAVPAQTVFRTEDKAATERAKTADGFRNFAARIGVGPDGTEDNLISGGSYNFNLVTRNRILLEAAYRGSWIVGRVVDTLADDMVRAGIDITTNEGAEDVTEIKAQWSRLQISQGIGHTIRWSRLYGGAIGVLQIKGQELSTPLDPDTISKGQFEGIAVYDRWQLNPSLSEIIDSGPDIGLPLYYDIVLGSNLNDPGQAPGGGIPSPTGRVRVHYTRCIRMEGIHLPFFQAITEMMWGESVLERMWDRLINFDTVTASVAALTFRASLRTVGIDGLREIVASGGAALEGLMAQFALMRQIQSNEGITLLDKEDSFQSTAYSFAGLSDVQTQAGQQVSGAAEIPLVALFGQSPAGMNATGEADLRLYYDSINSKQEAKLRNPVEVLLKILWLSVTGRPIPSDLTFTFTPLWQMSATDKATIAKTNTDTVIEAHDAGAVSTAVMMKELKQASGTNGLFTHITDEDIEAADDELPPSPNEAPESSEGSPNQPPDKAEKEAEEVPGQETGELSAGPTTPLKKKSNDSAWKKIRAWLNA
jgi:uncharacterized protein